MLMHSKGDNMSDEKNIDVLAGLAKLDAKNDDHWTENGLPRLDALGLKPNPLRQDVTAAAPLFTRANPVLEPVKAAEAPAPVVEATKPEVDLELLELEVAEAEAEVLKAEHAKTMAERAVRHAQVKRDALTNAIEKARPIHENILGIRAVLERSKQVRAEKANIAAELRAVGVTAALLQPGSRLDQAMARKRGFGTQRPQLQAQGAMK